MWNEVGAAAAGDSEAPVIGDVVHIGRSWFRMTPMPVAATKTAAPSAKPGSSEPRISMARSLFERTHAGEALPEEAFTDEAPEEVMFEPSRRTVTLSWWWVALATAGLLSIGALSSAMLLRRPLRAAAPVAARAAVVSAAPVVVPAPVAAAPAPVAAAAPVAPPTAAPAPVPPPAAPEVVAEPAVAPAAEASVAVPEPVAPAHRTERRAPAAAARTVSAARAVPAATRRPSRPSPSPSRAKASAPDSEKPWVDPFSQ